MLTPVRETRTFAPRRDPTAPGNLLARFLAVHVKASIDRARTPDQMAEDMWPGDHNLELLVRAASTPAQLGQTGWAAELGQKIVADTLQVLFPASAGAALLQIAPSLTFGREAQIGVPGFSAGSAGKTSAFVAERQPIPVFQPPVTGATLLPHKLAGIMVATREMIESSNAEAYMSDLMRQSFGRALDEVLVDANPAAASRPAGLRLGVSALTASTAGDSWGAFLADVGALADAVGAVASNAPVVFIGSPGRALKAGIMAARDFLNVRVLASNAVINDFLCVASAALISAVGVPEIEIAKVTALTMDDAPAPDPTTPVGPYRSLWQTDSIGIKCRWPVSWALRDPRGFSWLTPTGW